MDHKIPVVNNGDSKYSNNFLGAMDRYQGVTVDSTQEHCDGSIFSFKLTESLKMWTEKKIRGVWFKVALQHSDWVPILAKNGFSFHHAHPETVTMCRWLPEEETEPCNIPKYSHTMIGIGGLVVNSNDELLVVKERFFKNPKWKLPGGYLEPGEDMADAIVREVFEETGLRTRFVSLVTLRHNHRMAFGCSDIYMTAQMALVGEEEQIIKCPHEIAECKWIKIEEYLNHGEVDDHNKFFVRKFLENKERNTAMVPVKAIHPTFKTPQTIFSIIHDVAERN